MVAVGGLGQYIEYCAARESKQINSSPMSAATWHGMHRRSSPSHICAATCPTSAPRLAPHLHRDLPHICAATCHTSATAAERCVPASGRRWRMHRRCRRRWRRGRRPATLKPQWTGGGSSGTLAHSQCTAAVRACTGVCAHAIKRAPACTCERASVRARAHFIELSRDDSATRNRLDHVGRHGEQ